MHLGCIGLEAASQSIIAKLLAAGHDVHAWDVDGVCDLPDLAIATNVDEMIASISGQKIILIHVPNRSIAKYITILTELLVPGDIIIDLSDSLRRNSVKRYQDLQAKGIDFLDIGLGGGVQGAAAGYACFVGGDQEVFDQCKPIIDQFAAPEGIFYHPQAGAGHFAKMIHCGIEYGMMQAIAEGFSVLHASKHYDLDLAALAKVYGDSSTIASRLVSNVAAGYEEFPHHLPDLPGSVRFSKQGERVIHYAHEIDLPVPVIEESVHQRTRSSLKPSYASKVISLLRRSIGKRNVL